MGFVAPLVLLGLGALAMPVFMHLIQRERKRVVEFPSLMFLRRIPYQSVRRRRIRDWLLLPMRLAALALIVLAFARPFFRRDRAGGGGAERRARSGHPGRRSPTAWATAIAGPEGARPPRADAINALGARRPRVAGLLLVGRRSRRPVGRRSRPSDVRARRRQGRSWRDPLRACAQARRQPARGIGPAAARNHPDQRFPASRLGADARPGRRQTAGPDDADARSTSRPARRRTCR